MTGMVRTGGLVAVAAAGLLALALVLMGVGATDVRIAWTINVLALTAYGMMVVWFFTQDRTQAGETTKADTTPSTVEPREDRPAVYYDFKGDVHDVIDVEGIGHTYAKRLQAMGIHTTARLCYEDPQRIATELDVPLRTVQKWQAMSQLAKVNGIGKQYAEALVRAGVDGIDALKKRQPATIATQVQEYLDGLDSNVLGQTVSERRVRAWQAKAKPMRRVRQPVPTA